MASRGGIYYNKDKKEVKPEYFVKEARHHPNGFTVYKIIRRVPDPNSFDCFKESFTWKRYSDFKELYKCLATLHRKLFLNGEVPEFAKPKLFGRFEESVVRERKRSAENVLNFATKHPPLFKSAAFQEFFQDLQPIDSTSEIRYLRQSPLKPKVEKANRSAGSENLDKPADLPQSQLTQGDLQFFDPVLSTKEFIESTSTNQDETWLEQIKKTFPSGGEVQPKSDETHKPRDLDPEDEAELLEALKISVTQGDFESYHEQQKSQISSIQENQAVDGTGVGLGEGEDERTAAIRLDMDLDNPYVDANAREQHRKSSKASAYLEAVIRRNRLQSESEGANASRGTEGETSVVDLKTDGNNGIKNGGALNLQDKSIFGLPTRSSLLDLPKMFRDDSSDDESRGAYLVQAAQQISFARSAEIKLAHEEAFGHYKAAINTLLQGVQGDTNEARIQAVRRKTANYLKRAEDIHSNYLKTTIDTNDLWKPDSSEVKSSSPRPGFFYPPDVNRTRRDTSSPVPNIPSPRHNSKDLSCYKVLGTVGKVLLVLDTRNDESYAMKILVKSCQNRIRKGVIPTNVPYMVRLHRYYSTEQAVCLVMEHAAGGKLWDQLEPYFELARLKCDFPKSGRMQGQVGRLGELKGGVHSTPKKFNPLKDIQEDKKDRNKSEEEVEESTPSFLDVCMEFKTENPTDAGFSQKEEKEEDLVVSQPQSISDAIETQDVETAVEIPPPSVEGTSSAEPFPVQRSWSYLSWDDGPTAPTEVPIHPTDGENKVFSGVKEEKTEGLEFGSNWRSNFQSLSSPEDMKLFTIDQDEDDDVLEDSIYDFRSNDGSDSADEIEDTALPQELLSEQDMSAVSLLGDNMEKTLPSEVARRGSNLRSASPSSSRVIDASKASPCLSMNSSFEEDRRKSEDEKDSQMHGPTITRVIDENGVSSIDAKPLFRTHSRSRSTASVGESTGKSAEKPDIVKDVAIEEQQSEEKEEEGNNIHSLFVGMDEAKQRSMSYRIPEYTIQRWAAEIVVAVGTLHSIAILCRDLNPANILLSGDGHIRLSYFGKWRQVERKPCDKLAMQHMYVAPEMSKVNEKKTEACDWWSVGAIIYELMTGMPLYIAHPSGISSHTVLSLPEYMSIEAKSLLTGLLQYYPTQRLGYGIKGLDDLMDHPFFNDIQWDFLIEEFTSS